MKKQLNRWARRIDALSLRERVLAVVGAAAILYLLLELAVFGPHQRQVQALTKQMAQADAELAALSKATQALAIAPRATVDLSAQRAKLDALRKEHDAARALVSDASTDGRLGELVRLMSAPTPGVTVVSLKTVPGQPFYQAAAVAPAPAASGAAAPGAAASAPAVPALYRHGVEAVVQGSYGALVPYLQKLERGSIRVFWGDVVVETRTYPVAEMRFVLYTLSTRLDSPLN